MIDHALLCLKDQLRSYLRIKAGETVGEPILSKVVFVEDRDPKEVTLPENALTVLLVNLEEERLFRAGSVQANPLAQGNQSTNSPLLCINLFVLFVPHYKDYIQTLKSLSLVIQFFQSHRVFDQNNSPSLDPGIEKLTLELVNLPLNEQRDLWTGLGLSYMPSVLYKVRMVVFADDEAIDPTPEIKDPQGKLATR